MDVDLQASSEKILKKLLEDTDAKEGETILMNPSTGEILVMAHVPTYNPADGMMFGFDLRYANKAANLLYEPRSLFSLFTIAAGLEENTTDLNSEFSCLPSKKENNESNICNTFHGQHQRIADIIRNKCSTTISAVGEKLRENLETYAKRFQFEEQFTIELSYIKNSYIPSTKDVNNTTFRDFTLGKGIGITSLQLITGFATIVNEGEMMKPIIIKEIHDYDGKKVRKLNTVPVKRVITNKNAVGLKKSIENVIKDPNEKYPLGGISGKMGLFITDELKKYYLYKQGYYSKETLIDTYLGYFTANDTKYVMMVTIQEPNDKKKYNETLGAYGVYCDIKAKMIGQKPKINTDFAVLK